MKSIINAKVLTSNGTSEQSILVELPNKCPVCSVAYGDRPLVFYCVSMNQLYGDLAYAIYFCPHCGKCFYATYVIKNLKSSKPEAFLENVYPVSEAQASFNDDINVLSPKFVDIYHQAEVAEANGLTEICGLGYRKSLEFLIKDFAIKLNPDDVDLIKSMPLAKCINTYISDSNIKTLAERSAWLGNDEAHYIRKHENHDIQDMKLFIQATVYFIGMISIAKKAAAINPAR